MTELVLNTIIMYYSYVHFHIDPQAAKEERLLELCYDGTADIRDFSCLLAQGVDPDIYNKVGATAWQ